MKRVRQIQLAVAVPISLLLRGRGLVLLFLFGALLAMSVAATEAVSGTHQRSVRVALTDTSVTSPSRLFNLRVCAYEAFSKNLGACTKDQRKAILVSTRLACSVRIRAGRPGMLRMRMTYRGATVYEATRVLGSGPDHWWISYNLGTVPLPGGDWSCQFAVGPTTVRARFKSGGPTGLIIGAVACAGKDTILFGRSRGLRACRPDLSDSTPVTDEIVCSGVLPDAASKELTVQLLSGGVEVAAPYVDRVDGPLWIEWASFKPQSGRGRFAVGDYVCRFSIDGITVAEAPLQLTPS
jgi:hypothetical protein